MKRKALMIVCLSILLFGAGTQVLHAGKSNPLRTLMSRMNILKLPARVKAPDFTLEDVHGRTVRLKDHQGKVVMINFWTTW